MASTYVNDLRLNEMATGDQSGSWGTVTNLNLEMIGEAFSYGTEIIGNADTAINIPDGASDPSRSFFLKINSSANLTTTRVITLGPNTVSKVWMIENATSGNQVITIKQGTGATINVPNGQVKMIATNGAGGGASVIDLLVDVDLTGTTTAVNLNVSGDISFADDSKAIFGADSDLQVYSTGANGFIENNTGLLTLKNNSDDSDIALQSDDGAGGVTNYLLADGSTGALNAYHYGDLKLATSATGIDITGGFAATNGSTITTADNSIQLELISTDADNLSGSILNLYRDSASPAANDNVGQIEFSGRNNVNAKILYADIQAVMDDVTDGTEDGSLKIRTAGDGGFRNRMDFGPTEIRVNASSVDLDFRIQSDTKTHAFFVQGSDGFVGINKAAPATALDVTGSITASGSVNIGDDLNITGPSPIIKLIDNDVDDEETRIQNASGSTFIDSRNGTENGAIVFRGNGGGTNDEYARFIANGNFGIGVANPTHELSVVSAADTKVEIKSTGTGDADAVLILDSAADGESEIQFFHDGVLGANIQWFTDGSPDLNIMTADGTNGVIDFQPNNLNAMRIQSDGNVRIGNSAISATITGLTQTNLVVGSATGGEIVAYRNDATLAEGDFVGAFLFGNDDNTATEDHFAGMWATAHGTGGSVDIRFAAQKGLYEAGTSQMLLRSEGDLLVGTTSTTNYNNDAGTEDDNGFLYLESGVLSVSSYKASANVGFVQYLNRTSTDGGFLEFRKNGVAVGVVGVASGDLTIGTTDTGFRFLDGSEQIIPWNLNGNTNKDGVLDLGNNSNRFDNLYLAGGVIFGDQGGVGPSISNTFDSYETGTFTMGVTFSSTDPTAGPTQASGYYVKTGNSCTVWLNANNINVTGGAGDLRLNNSGGSNGLPFVSRGVGVTGLGTYMGPATISHCNVASTCTQINTQQLDGVNYIRFTEQLDATSTDVINVANCTHGATDITLCMTYPVA